MFFPAYTNAIALRKLKGTKKKTISTNYSSIRILFFIQRENTIYISLYLGKEMEKENSLVYMPQRIVNELNNVSTMEKKIISDFLLKI